jgi:hypothetical protein
MLDDGPDSQSDDMVAQPVAGQSQGRLDADVLRGEGDRVMAELEQVPQRQIEVEDPALAKPLVVDLESMERAIRSIEKQAMGLEEITRLSGAIRSNSAKILHRARIMQKTLGDQVRLLDEGLGHRKAVLQRGDQR